MSAGNFFKRNEKVIMVVLLALIAPTFAFTGIIYTVMQQEDPVVTKLFGQPISSSDIGQAQRTMRDQRRIQGATVIGALAFQPQNRRFFQVSTDEAIDFIMWK
ncbi:MAG: SurA N-terminal domain-containing protein, partial [Planctomycetota bacterium]